MENKIENLFIEEVIEMGPCNIPSHSTVRKATPKDIKLAKKKFDKTGKCDHSVIFDESGWAYDIRYCYTCKEMIGLI